MSKLTITRHMFHCCSPTVRPRRAEHLHRCATARATDALAAAHESTSHPVCDLCILLHTFPLLHRLPSLLLSYILICSPLQSTPTSRPLLHRHRSDNNSHLPPPDLRRRHDPSEPQHARLDRGILRRLRRQRPHARHLTSPQRQHVICLDVLARDSHERQHSGEIESGERQL